MRKTKTHFEQVPMDDVRTILKRQAEADEADDQRLPAHRPELEENPFEPVPVIAKGWGERS